MKLFDNASKSEGKQKEMEAEQLRIQQEAGRQKSLEKKLDELILVGKAIYTIFKQEHEDRKAAYENLENVIQTATSEMIQKQEKAVKIMVAYGREDNQKAITAVREEFAKVQEASEEVKKQLLMAAEEINNSILDNTSVLSGKLSGLEESIKDINISVEAAPVVSIPVPEMEEADVSDLSLDYEEEVILEEDFGADIIEEDLEENELDFMLMPEMEEETAVEEEISEEISEDIFAVLEEEFALMEEEPEEIPEPVPAPVMDDPNRAMTPDEIAALIASMN